MMAYFGSNYYEAEPGLYLPTPYGGGHDFSQSCHSHNVLTPYSCTEFDQPSFFPYHPYPFVGAYDHHAPTGSVISNSVSTVSQSEVVVYDPAATYGGGYGDFKTQFTISYNESGFNDIDFEEYDPTPYGGGYDMAQTYGKALSPSDEICYPRDAPPAVAPCLDPLPIVKREADHESASEPQKGSEPSKFSEKDREQEQAQGHETDHGSNLEEPLGSSQSVEIGGNYYDDYYPWTGYEYDKRECEMQAPEAPWGYSPEAMDFCESIFGYWPCLYKKRHHGRQEATYDERNNNSWAGTEDFLFGSSQPCTDGGSQEDALHGYERHYPEQRRPAG